MPHSGGPDGNIVNAIEAQTTTIVEMGHFLGSKLDDVASKIDEQNAKLDYQAFLLDEIRKQVSEG